MKRSILNAWIVELRNPANQQCTGALKRPTADGGCAYCCLGLFMDKVLKVQNRLGTLDRFAFITPSGETDKVVLPTSIAIEHGFIDGAGGSKLDPPEDGDRLNCLSVLNDGIPVCTGAVTVWENRHTFAQIADRLESQPENYFHSIEEDLPTAPEGNH